MRPIQTRQNWTRRAAASCVALATAGAGLVGLAVPATARPAECVPSDAYSYQESIYTQSVQANESPGAGWTEGAEVSVELEPAYDQEQRMWRRWVGPRLRDWEQQWVPVLPYSTPEELAALVDAGWLPSLQTKLVPIPAVTRTDHIYTFVTGWLTESENPGEGWEVVDTRTIDVPAVVCGVPSLKADRGSQLRGGSMSLTALGFLEGEDVEFVMHSTPVVLGTAAADAAGTAVLSAATIPTDASIGTHTIVATGRTSERTASLSFEVVAQAAPAAPRTPAAPRSLASTGAETAALLGLAGLLMLSGAALFTLRRRGADGA